jgi:FAD/FMN-containing dehydrogenase
VTGVTGAATTGPSPGGRPSGGAAERDDGTTDGGIAAGDAAGSTVAGAERLGSSAERRAAGRGAEPAAAATVPAAASGRYRAAVAALRQAYAELPAGEPVRLAKPTSNLFRFRDPAPARHGLDVSAFGQVLHVDPVARTAVVGGMTTYEHLADATLRYGMMPLVVPQLKTITLGGAVTGLGIESTSLRNGLPHESVIEMEILTGDGRVVTAAPEGEHARLFRGFPNSYGTLGYALSLTIELEPVKPYVHLRHRPFGSLDDCMRAVGKVAAEGTFDGAPVDFVDGIAFGPDEVYLTLGTFSDVAPWLSDYTGQRIYYRSVQQYREDFLTIRDYLWRWDTDWFWCSRPFGVQNPAIRRMWPRKYRRSDVYRRLVAFDRRYGLTEQMNRSRQVSAREDVIQDVEIPVERGARFLDFFFRDIGMSPVWLCPLRLRSGASWPLYPLEPGHVYVNFGFWGTVPLEPGQPDGYHNRLVEDEVTALGGRKGLYSTAFYTEEEFWRQYNGQAYQDLKRAYDPDGRLLGLYDKCVRGR